MNKPNIDCLGKKVLILQDKITEKMSSGGIIIAEKIAEQVVLVTGVVISVSPEVKNLKEGDKVLYPQAAGTKHEIDGVNYTFVTQDGSFQNEVWAIL